MSTDLRVVIANGRFVLGRRLGGGAFGEVYTCMTIAEPVEEFAVKLEHSKSGSPAQLQHEARVYMSLARGGVNVGIPKVRWVGTEGDFNVLVMELVGPSLSDLMEYCSGRFDSKTCMILAHQAISRLQYVHACGYLHRDLKPDNLAMGLGKRSHHLYLIDFGLAKKYRDNNGHIPFRDGKSLTGTARYVSIATHKGQQQSRRDDLESLAHVLIFIGKANLPWQSVQCRNKQERFDKIMAMKIATPPSVLCTRLPPAFAKLLTYSRALKFEEEPHYEQCRQFFEADMSEKGYEFDYGYMWVADNCRDTLSHSRLSSVKEGSSISGAPQAANSTRGGVSTTGGSLLGSHRSGFGGRIRPGGNRFGSPLARPAGRSPGRISPQAKALDVTDPMEILASASFEGASPGSGDGSVESPQ